MVASSPPPPPHRAARARSIERARETLRRSPVLVVLGLPGSGRSDWVNRLRRRFARGARPAVTARPEPGESSEQLAARIHASVDPNASPTGDPEALLAAIEQRGALLVVDDLDRLDNDAVLPWIASASGALQRGRAVFVCGRRPRCSASVRSRIGWVHLPHDDDEPTELDPPLHARLGKHPHALRLARQAMARGVPIDTACADAARTCLEPVLGSLTPPARRLLETLASCPPELPLALACDRTALERPHTPLGELYERLLLASSAERLELAPVVRSAARALWDPLEPDPTILRSMAQRLASTADVDALEAAAGLFERLGEPAGLWRCLDALAPLWFAAGRAEHVEQRLRSACEHSEALPPWAAIVRLEALLELQRFDDAERLAAGLSDDTPLAERWQARRELALARLAAHRARLAEARTRCEGLAARLRACRECAHAVRARCLEAYLAAASWDLEAARNHAETALEDARNARFAPTVARALRAESWHTLASAHYRARRFEEAAPALEQAMSLHLEAGRLDRALITLQQQVVVLSELGRTREALAWCARVTDAVPAGARRGWRALVQRAAGFANLHAARYREAARAFAEAARDFERLGHRPRQIAALLGLAEAEAGAGHGQRANDAFRTAAEVYVACGDERAAAEVALQAAWTLAELDETERARWQLAQARARIDRTEQPDARWSAVRATLLDRLLAAREQRLAPASLAAELATLCAPLGADAPPGLAAELRLLTAVAHWRAGALGAAERQLEQAGACMPSAPVALRLARDLLALQIARERGERLEAGALERNWERRLEEASPYARDRAHARSRLLGLEPPADHVVLREGRVHRCSYFDVLRLRTDAAEAQTLLVDTLRGAVRLGCGPWRCFGGARVPRAVFEWLAWQHPEPVTVQQLFEAVWASPGYDARARRQVVQTAVRRARRCVEPEPDRPTVLVWQRRARGYAIGRTWNCVVFGRSHSFERARLPGRERLVLALLEEHGPLPRSAIEQRLGLPSAAVRAALRRLREAGFVRCEGRGPASRYVPTARASEPGNGPPGR